MTLIFFKTRWLFVFFTLTPNDRGYGHLAVCGSIRCRETTKWMREQNRRNARQPANEHRRVLGARWCVLRCLGVRRYKISFNRQHNFERDDRIILCLSNVTSCHQRKAAMTEVSPPTKRKVTDYRISCSGSFSKPPCGADFSRIGTERQGQRSCR